MKKIFTIILSLVISLSGFGQFPKSGATWIFDTSFFPWMDANGQKWEYTGESTTSQGILKNFSLTTKFVNPGSYPFDTTLVQYSSKQFLYIGDTIWDMSDTLSPIANFSLQVGDSSYTPYHTSQNMGTHINNCAEDSFIVYQKGFVTETGVEAVDGIDSRFYVLSFMAEMNQPQTAKFSERSIISSGYWRIIRYTTCTSIVEATPYYLTCFYDDSSSTPCSSSWFENLSIDKSSVELINIFPNPTSDFVNIQNPTSQQVYISVTDLQGRVIMQNNLLHANSTTQISVSGWSSGIYVVQLSIDGNKMLCKKLVKN